MDIIKINNITMPCPSRIDVTIQDFQSDNSGRSADGTMHIDVVATKRQLLLGWNYLTSDEICKLFSVFNGSDTYQVYFPDATTNTFMTRTMYVGDRTTSVRRIRDNGVIDYHSIEVTLVEV